MNFLARIERTLAWHREHDRILRELSSYSNRELLGDLRISRSDIEALATTAADELLAARDHEERRRTASTGWEDSLLTPAV